MTERRYTDDEIASIFRIASEGSPLPERSTSTDDALSLTDLQAIGRDVGISPDAVARAALAIDMRREPPRTFLGFPIGVTRTVDLGRRMTDDEWERFVVQLRDVFDATGTVRSEGSLRQWRNGNLHVMLEPTTTGHRLRFRTLNARATASFSASSVTMVVAAGFVVAGVISGRLPETIFPAVVIGVVSVAMFANAALRLPRWARLRGQQMEALAAGVEASRSD
ncbi:MAG TPA: hypothetical protein VGM67_18475 [Gemmatimonadaceae bacterium]|jgi:hypothetical protein